ncbi:hypothetical protein COY54_00410, partial [Candidatus Falkowbacteria bacterium CG_4_10_14_0_8_um_filter_41_36]
RALKMTASLIISSARKKVFWREWGFLKEDWEPFQDSLILTFTANPLAILGVLMFGIGFIISTFAAIIRIIFCR